MNSKIVQWSGWWSDSRKTYVRISTSCEPSIFSALDSTTGSDFASLSGHSAVADVRFRLVSDRTVVSGAHLGLALNSDRLLVPDSSSHSANHDPSRPFPEDLARFTLIVGAYSDFMILTGPMMEG